MTQEINKQEAASLWRMIGLTVENVLLRPRQHRGSVTFCGYVDIKIWLHENGSEAIPFLHLSGTAIKLIDGKLHFDPKAEKGKGDRSTHHFPIWLPFSSAARAALTFKLSALPEIQQMIADTQAQLSGSITEAS